MGDFGTDTSIDADGIEHVKLAEQLFTGKTINFENGMQLNSTACE